MASTKDFNIIERLSVAFNNNDTLSIVCADIASEIENRRIKLFEVIEELGIFLTNIDENTRENGVCSLSNLLSNISQSFLNEQEIQFMTSFYCDRLNDHPNIIPAVISGILAIVQMDNLPKGAPSKLLNAIFHNIRCQSELQQTRRNIYSIFQTLLSSRLEECKLLGPDFVYGVISSMDGESDPRNLKILFTFLPQFIREFNLHHLVEEMFEVIACYFPVDFNSGTNNERKITREDLVHSLELCLSAIPQFAPYCLPLIIDKLDSNLKIAKIDSLRLLRESSSIFGVEGLKDHLDELWPLIRREVLPGNDQELKEQALNSITAITRALLQDEKVMVAFIEKIIADTRTSLCDVQLSLYWPAEKLIEAVSRANDKACCHILKTVVALCLAQYTTKISKIDRISLIETLNNFITIYTGFGLNISDISELSWTDLTSLYLNELSSIKDEDALKAKLIDGLAIQKASLTPCHREILYNTICDEIDSGNENTKQSCRSIFISLGEQYPNEILNVMREKLALANIETRLLNYRINAFSPLGKIPNLGSSILPILVDLAFCDEPEVNLVALNSIKELLMSQNFQYNIHYYLYNNCNIIDKICHHNSEIEHKKGYSCEIRHLLSNIWLLIMRKLSAKDQQIVVEEYFDLLEVDIDRNILLWEGILTSLMPCNITLRIIQLSTQFLEISIYNISDDTRQSSCRLVAVIFNKIYDNDNFETYLNLAREKIMCILNDNNINIKQKQAAVLLCTYITKALVTRGHQQSENFLNFQINLLRNEFIREFTGEKFKIFVDRYEHTLIDENFCIIKVFYKQRIFENILKKNENFIGDSRQSYLIALICIVEEISMELLFMHLAKLVPLLIESLSLDNGQLILSTLKILKLLLSTKDEIFVEQIQSFIPRCLKLSTHSKMHVRIAALNCLTSYCDLPTSSVKPYKDDVLEKLSEAIDDRKRLVRQTAVTARIRWYLVGSPGGPE